MTEEEVEAVLAEIVRPVIEADHGTIELVEVRGDVVVVHLGGACAGCPGAPHTRAGVIEATLQRRLERMVRVELYRGPR